jgi:hypothetical protein
MRKRRLTAGLILVGMLAAPGVVGSQTAQEDRTLIVSGQPGQAQVIRQNGRSYVDVEALARLMNGSLGFKGNQITLSLPASTAAASAAAPGQEENSAFSPDFLKGGIETLAVIKEWQGALMDALKNGYPTSDTLLAVYQARAARNLKLTYVARSTDGDRNGYQLLSNELANMQKLSNKILAAHREMQNITPDALDNDPLNQQILSCARSLVSIAASGQFQDEVSCH